MQIKRNAKIISKPADNRVKESVLLIDQIGTPTREVKNRRAVEKLLNSIDADPNASCVEAERTIDIVGGQYATRLERTRPHRLCTGWRGRRQRARLLAYRGETRDDPTAAPLHMDTGTNGALPPRKLSHLQAQHVAKVDHDTFFENSSPAPDCSHDVVHSTCPAPVTMERIHRIATR